VEFTFRKENVEQQLTNFQLVRQGERLLQQSDEETGRSPSCEDLEAIAQRSAFKVEIEGQVYQTLLLPDGASATCPKQIIEGNPFFLEIGWLRSLVVISKNVPLARQRLIRRYNEKGEWVSLTWVTEQKIA
jgi:hypothetical protein